MMKYQYINRPNMLMFASWDIAYLTGKPWKKKTQCKLLQKLQFRFKWFAIGCFQRPLEICALDTNTWMRFFSMRLLDYNPPLLSRRHKCSVTVIFSGSPPRWFCFNCESFFVLESLTFMVNIGLLSQQAWKALGEPAVISVSASPVRVSHPIQKDSQGFHGNLLSQLHKRVLRVLRDLAR